MAKLVLALALAAALVAAAQGQSVYRIFSINKWSETNPTRLAELARIEVATVTPCLGPILRGIYGLTNNVTGQDSVSFVKIYDFRTLADYRAYKDCGSRYTGPNTDAQTTVKARYVFKVPANSALPAVGTSGYVSIANSTNPTAAVRLRNQALNAIKCTLTRVYGSYVADSDGSKAVSYPTNTGWYAFFPEPAGLTGFWYYQRPPAPTPSPRVLTQVRQFYQTSSLNLGFVVARFK